MDIKILLRVVVVDHLSGPLDSRVIIVSCHLQYSWTQLLCIIDLPVVSSHFRHTESKTAYLINTEFVRDHILEHHPERS